MCLIDIMYVIRIYVFNCVYNIMYIILRIHITYAINTYYVHIMYDAYLCI